ncbi:unnamed protein product [Caenorhabditis auriculariae]|uniref:Uncharacterized protein n=1 Tax=Caenorhabditis auriculariae TaxID=2777116 RepID=A0A8S1H1R9_9PELO|nr:unnamed protein product [Caenorhabditis auriculariae]
MAMRRELLLRTSFSAPLRIANRFEGCSAYLGPLITESIACPGLTLAIAIVRDLLVICSDEFLVFDTVILAIGEFQTDSRFLYTDLLELGILTWCIIYTLGSVRIYESAKSLSLRFLCDPWRPMNLVEPRGRSDQRLSNPAMTVAHSAVQESLDCRLLFLAMKPLSFQSTQEKLRAKVRNVSYQITAASDPRGRLTLVRRLSPPFSIDISCWILPYDGKSQLDLALLRALDRLISDQPCGRI